MHIRGLAIGVLWNSSEGWIRGIRDVFYLISLCNYNPYHEGVMNSFKSIAKKVLDSMSKSEIVRDQI